MTLKSAFVYVVHDFDLSRCAHRTAADLLDFLNVKSNSGFNSHIVAAIKYNFNFSEA
jgi:hypothetical protein